MYFFYRILSAASVIFLAPYYALRGWRRREPSSTFRERLGGLSREIMSRASQVPSGQGQNRGPVWIHAVSVGEVLAAKPLAEGLKRRFPDRPVFVSTTTETGQRLARERLDFVDGIFYFPLDWIISVRRALHAIRPALVIVMETEIWPNFLREARRRDVPVVFANARISEKSFARFKKWEFLVGPFYERVLADADLFLAQTPEDAARLSEMGASDGRVEVTGNLKYDSDQPDMSRLGVWLEGQIQRQERWPVLVAGSVVAGEEEAVLAAYDLVQRRWRRALLLLAPRKPDRFDAAVQIAEAGGWNVLRRTHVDLEAPLDENVDVFVLDSIGELAGLYLLADAVFVGGSLVPAGGHNILEPAWFAKPPVFGPSMENFRDMAAQFLRARAAVQVTSGQQLGKVWIQLIEDDKLREEMGRAARDISERNRGATERSLERIAAALGKQEHAA
ncbi:MAG TPA: 3-deoxy-D-manno-octulosonic acid transferase [Candidatus Acidoferrales bacterium]|nr:3-deoxy-D-manno-octulosonic acid transferase [Candidatus Acidoferrales bacterium]